MREILEDISICIALLILTPIVALVLLFGGMVLLWASPIFLAIYILIFLIWVKKRDKIRLRKGKVKLIVLPGPLKRFIGKVFSIILGILILALYLWIMLFLPIWLSGTITCCVIGYGTGLQIGKKGGN